MNRHGGHQFIQEALAFVAALRRVGSGESMSKFEQRHDRDGDFLVAGLECNRFEQLPRIPAHAFGGAGEAGFDSRRGASEQRRDALGDFAVRRPGCLGFRQMRRST